MAQAPLLLLIGSLALAGPVSAETDPYYFGGSLGYTHVSNLFRLPQSQVPNRDDVTTASLLAGIDKPFGRQRVYADAALRHNSYRRDSSLNNTGYSLSSGLDWEALDKLSGNLQLRSSRNLANYNASTDVAAITEKNIEQNNQLLFNARYGLAGKLSLEGGAAYQERKYSAAAYQLLEYQQHSVSAGVGYRPNGDLRLGLIGRYTEGDGHARMQNLVVPNAYQRKDLDLTGNWTASAASTLTARLSVSKIENDNSNLRDYSGVTGRISWQWRPSGKLQLNTALARDTVQENYLSTGNTGGGDANRVGTSVQLGASYSLTSKILFDAGANLYKLNRSGANAADEDNQSLSLGVRWLPTRGTQLSCQLSRDKRDSDITTLNYSANSYGCTAQLMLR